MARPQTLCAIEVTGTIRPAHKGDLADMWAIDTLVSSMPWSLSQFAPAFESAASSEQSLVLHTTDGIAGFVIYHCVFDEGSIYNIGIAPQQQRRGYGQELLQAAMANMFDGGVTRCLLEVRKSNMAARGLYESLGFQADGVRGNYYRNGDKREDALLMSKLL